MRNNEEHRNIIIGCVADDFTGASDIASFFAQGGLKVVMVNGLPDQNYQLTTDTQVLVIALKTRSVDPNDAVDQSLEAVRWLKQNGCERYFFKYCSTFDSTPQGNIGPVIDSLLEEFNLRHTIISPALPVNGRTVKNGELFVNGVPLDESPMKNHPITPMWNSRIAKLMQEQGKYETVVIDEDVLSDIELLNKTVNSYLDRDNFSKYYFVPDYFKNEHAKMIVEGFGDLSLLTGSSGLAFEIARRYSDTAYKHKKTQIAYVKDKGVIISGSCSTATKKQIQDYISRGGSSIKIDPVKLLSDEESIEKIYLKIIQNQGENILVYSCDDGHLSKDSKFNQSELSKVLEETMGELARELISNGFKRIVVAGGETSGAVIKALPFSSFAIGESVSPGVPVLIPEEESTVRLVLKSGNFGDEDFFTKTLALM